MYKGGIKKEGKKKKVAWRTGILLVAGVSFYPQITSLELFWQKAVKLKVANRDDLNDLDYLKS